MKPWIERQACMTRKACRACRSDHPDLVAATRAAGAPEICPFGVTAATLAAERPPCGGPPRTYEPRPDRDAICQTCDEWNGNICEAAKCCQQNRAEFLAVGRCPLHRWLE